MRLRDLIAAKRDGHRHSAEDLKLLAHAAAEGSAPDYQLSAWLMAAYLNGLDEEETAALTLAMAGTGERLDLSALPKPWVDKHSTGGVGDKTTIALLPILAAAGLTVVKMSGRGLGITGGTVDKLASIPGFRLDLSPDEMIAQAGRIGLALTGQTPRLAPADKTLYALRDATETVASLPLIVSSILSKKIAGGADVLGLDVKCGSGAFMADLEHARALASALKRIGERCGLSVHTTITDMDQPLGRTVGNALEVREAFDTLIPGSTPTRFGGLVRHLAAETLVAVQRAKSLAEGITIVDGLLAAGKPLERARAWVGAQGGDPGVVDGAAALMGAIAVIDVRSPSEGFAARVDARTVGQVVVALGGGRQAANDVIDPAVGVETLVEVGDRVEAGSPVFRVHARSHEDARIAATTLLSGLSLAQDKVSPIPVVLESAS